MKSINKRRRNMGPWIWCCCSWRWVGWRGENNNWENSTMDTNI